MTQVRVAPAIKFCLRFSLFYSTIRIIAFNCRILTCMSESSKEFGKKFAIKKTFLKIHYVESMYHVNHNLLARI